MLLKVVVVHHSYDKEGDVQKRLKQVGEIFRNKDIILDIPEQEVITKDNAVILANAVAFIKVSKVDRAVYGVENFKEARNYLLKAIYYNKSFLENDTVKKMLINIKKRQQT